MSVAGGKMMAAEQSATPRFLSAHPASANRTAELERHIPQVMPLYEAAAARSG
jgi:predicted Zn-dependent protease